MKKNKKWVSKSDGLQKEFVFKSFSEALAFVVRVGVEAEKMNHHPDIDIRWNKVLLLLITHDAGNKITDKDRKLAQTIDKLL